MLSRLADSCNSQNLSVLSSVYHTKGFTKYAIYTVIAYGVTKNPKMGLLALNCNTAAAVVFNYVRFFNPELFRVYKDITKEKCHVGELMFQAGDLLVHILPLCLVVNSRKYWYDRVSYRATIAVSMGSYLYQLAWAYHYAKGINVCKAYGMPEEYNNMTRTQWKRLWFLVFLCHNVTAIQKTTRYYLI